MDKNANLVCCRSCEFAKPSGESEMDGFVKCTKKQDTPSDRASLKSGTYWRECSLYVALFPVNAGSIH
jgi:hypothetical protein